MSARESSSKSGKKPSYEAVIHIVGPNELQNELLATHLAKEQNLMCRVGQRFEIPSVQDSELADTHLILFDCFHNDLEPLWETVEKGEVESLHLFFVTLFNVPPREDITRAAMAHKARGVFFKGTNVTTMTRGINAILDGELWYSREALSQFLMEPRKAGSLPEEVAEQLTGREKEILTKIANGASNKEIADGLFISLHTVKSHIYNIYRKIGVTNRLKAAQWVAKHLKKY